MSEEKLLPKPPMVFAIFRAADSEPRWSVWDGQVFNAVGGYEMILPSELEVVPHPENDDEAVEIIKSATAD